MNVYKTPEAIFRSDGTGTPNGVRVTIGDWSQVFDHDPTDDEIAAVAPVPVRLRPTTIAQRVEAAADLSRNWNALNDAASRAATDPDFTAQERTRLNNLRDLAKAALKGYV